MAGQTAVYEVQLKDSASSNADGVVNSFKKIQTQAKSTADDVVKSQDKIKNATGNGAKGADKAGDSIKKLGDFGKAIGGPFSGASEKLEKFGKIGNESGGKVSGGMMVAAAAIAIVVVEVVKLTAEFVHFAFASADAARSANLLAQATLGSAEAADALESQVNSLGNKVGIGKDKITQMGLELARAGLQGEDLAKALESVAVATSAAGDAAGGKLKTIAENAQDAGKFLLKATDLKGTGLSTEDVAGALAKNLGISFAQAKAAIEAGTVDVNKGLDALNDAVKSKFGTIAAKQALSLDHQIDQLKSNLAGLFSGINIEPLLDGLHELFSLFDQSTASGKFLKQVFSDIFGPIAALAGSFFKLLKIGFQEIEIAALRILIFLAPLINAFKAIAKSIDFSGLIKIFKILGTILGGAIIVYITALVAQFLVIATVVAVVIKVITAIINVIVAVVSAVFNWIMSFKIVQDAIKQVSAAIDLIITTFDSVVSYLESLDFGAIATNLINGLVNGIKNGAGLVIDAVKSLGSGAMSALKGVLGIHSPSTVFKAYGNFTAQGFAQGVDQGSDQAENAITDMVSYPKTDSITNNSSSSRSVTIGQITITGVSGAEDIVDKIKEVMVNIVEGHALTVGTNMEAQSI